MNAAHCSVQSAPGKGVATDVSVESIHYPDLWKRTKLNAAWCRSSPSWLVKNWTACQSQCPSSRAPVWALVTATPLGEGRRQSKGHGAHPSMRMQGCREGQQSEGITGQGCKPICMVGFIAMGEEAKSNQRESWRNHLVWTRTSLC